MDDKELFQLRQKWYSSEDVLFELVKNMVGRETVFLQGKVNIPLYEKRASPVRMIKAHKVEFLKKNFEAFDFYNKPYNIYTSVALLQNMPMASFNPVQRKIDQQGFFHTVGFDLCFKGYDLFFDLDAKKKDTEKKIEDVNAIDVPNVIEEYYDISGMYEDAKKFKAILDEFGMPYSVRFSGLKGFHFVIKDHEIFSQNIPNKEKVLLAKKMAENIQAVDDIPTMDLSIYDQTRIQKVPYSMEGYFVCLPLTDEQFNNWKIEDMQIDKVLKKIQVKYRGTLTRPKTKDSAEFVKLFGGI